MTDTFISGIVKEPRFLEEGFTPDSLVNREQQLEQLHGHLAGVGRIRDPSLVWVHGPSGSGKTASVRSVLDRLEGGRVRTAFVTCARAQTYYAVLDAVFGELRALVDEARDVTVKADRLYQLAKKYVLVIALDEVDQMFRRDRNLALYNFSTIPSLKVVCLSPSRVAYQSLDDRVKSRLPPAFVPFSAYPSSVLVEILRHRAERSLAGEAWCQADLRRLAEGSQGDARVALQGLRLAAYQAEKARASQLRAADIAQGLQRGRELDRDYVLKQMSEHHRLLHHLVKEAGRIDAVSLWRTYLKRAPEFDLEPMARRTFIHYKQHLVVNRLLRERQARGKKNRRVLEVVE